MIQWSNQLVKWIQPWLSSTKIAAWWHEGYGWMVCSAGHAYVWYDLMAYWVCACRFMFVCMCVCVHACTVRVLQFSSEGHYCWSHWRKYYCLASNIKTSVQWKTRQYNSPAVNTTLCKMSIPCSHNSFSSSCADSILAILWGAIVLNCILLTGVFFYIFLFTYMGVQKCKCDDNPSN